MVGGITSFKRPSISEAKETKIDIVSDAGGLPLV
jgi:hypothetical protein